MAWKRYTETGDFLDYIRPTQEKNEPNGLHSRVLKDKAFSIGLLLITLNNMSLPKVHVSHAWKEGKITPIYKKAARQMQEINGQLVQHMS